MRILQQKQKVLDEIVRCFLPGGAVLTLILKFSMCEPNTEGATTQELDLAVKLGLKLLTTELWEAITGENRRYTTHFQVINVAWFFYKAMKINFHTQCF